MSVYIDNPGHDTCIDSTVLHRELNQHLLHTRFIANQGDNRWLTDNLIHRLLFN